MEYKMKSKSYVSPSDLEEFAENVVGNQGYEASDEGKVLGIVDGAVQPVDGALDQVQADWDEADTEDPAYIKNKPTIPAAQVQADWNEADSAAADYIKNKPTIPAAQVQADWNEADTEAADYIKNKPTIPAEITVDASMIQDSTNPVQSKVIQTALLDKPNIQVWNNAPTTASAGVVGDFWLDTSNNKLYQLKAVTPGVDPDPTTYTWTEVGGGSSDDPIENKIVVYSSPNLILDGVTYTTSDFIATFIVPYVKSNGKTPGFWMVDSNGGWIGLIYPYTIDLSTDGFKYVYVRYVQPYLYSSNYEITIAFNWTASTEEVGVSWLTAGTTRDYNGVVHQASSLEQTINAGTYADDTTLLTFTVPSGKYCMFTILILPTELVSLIRSGDVKIFNAGFFNLTLKTTASVTLNADARCSLASICAAQPYANIWSNIGMNTQDYAGLIVIREYDAANQTFKQYFPETY